MDQVHLYAPIEKTDDEQRMVYGYASTEALDSQGEIVKKEALTLALADYMKFANIREMHQPSAVGKTKKANIDTKGLYIAAKVVDEKAWQKVKEGVYNGFSIGGRVKTMVDNEITDLSLAEISLVDRPANPEAIFDVWKAEGGKPDAAVEKSIWNADFLVDLACNLSNYIQMATYDKKDTADLEAALKQVKSAAAKELKESDKFTAEESAAIELAQSTLTKATDETPVDETPTEPQSDAPESPEKPLEDESGTPTPPAEEKPVDSEPAAPAEEVKETADEPTDLEKIDAKIKAGDMPTDAELELLLKHAEIAVTGKNIDILRYELAGKILAYVQKAVADGQERDAQEQALKKAQAKTPVVVADQPHQFDEVKLLITKLEKALGDENHGTTRTVTPPPASQVLPESPAEMQSKALAMLQEVVALLAGSNQGNQMTPKEENAEENGSDEGSERTSQGRFNPENKDTSTVPAGILPASGHKAEQTRDLAKLEGEISTLKAQIEKLASTPMPVKVKTTYTTVDKIDTDSDTKAQLVKAEGRADELAALMKANPYNQEYVREAQQLSSEIMKLRRAA